MQAAALPGEDHAVCVRSYVTYPLSVRQLEEMMAERGVVVDHSTIHRWAIKMLPVLAAVCHRRKLPGDCSWQMEETYVKVGGQWKHPYRAIGLHSAPEKITIDKGSSNTAAIVSVQVDSGLAIELRQSKYLNNVVEQATGRSNASCGRGWDSSPFAVSASQPCAAQTPAKLSDSAAAPRRRRNPAARGPAVPRHC